MTTRRWTRRDERAELIEHVEHWASFILSNILWVIVSLPIITLPAATAGLFAVMMARARSTPAELFEIFFQTMRRVWLKATLLMLVNVLVAGVVVVNLSILPQMNMADPLAFLARSITLFVGVMLLLVNLYTWSLLVIVEMPLKLLIQSSFRLVFTYPLWSIGVLVAAAAPVLISLLLPQAIFLIATVSVCVLIVCLGTWRVIRRHLPDSSST